MNIEETKKYINRRLSDLGWSVRIDREGLQTIQKYTGGDKERLNQLYYKMVSVGSRQEKREINADTIQIAIDDLRRMNEIVDKAPMKLGQNNTLDFDRVTIEQLASSLEQKVAEEIESAVVEAGKQAAAKASEPSVGGNGQDHAARTRPWPKVAAATGGTSGKPRILVVDDSPTIRAAVTKALENDFEFVEASDGERAWRLLRANSDIKLVVTDLMMPKMDGYDLIKRIRAAKKDAGIVDLPIIVVTALEDTQAKLHALMAGANDFITKSTDTLELHARVMARYQLSQALENAEPGSSRAAAASLVRMGPAPRQVAAAMVGTRSPPTIAKQAARIKISAKSQGNGNSILKTGAAVTEIQTPPRVAGNAGEMYPEPSGIRAWIDGAIEIVAVGYHRLARVDSTTGLTLLASFLVLVTITGVIFVNRSQTKPTTRPGENPTAVAPTNESKPSFAERVEMPATGKVTFGSAAAQDADTSRSDSSATADRAPLLEKGEPARAEAPKPEASKETRAAAAVPPQVPVTQRRAAAGATKPQAAPARTPAARAPAPTPEIPPPAASTPPIAMVPAAATAPAPNTRLTQAELSTLINKFVFVYQAGDIEQFLSLFDDGVRTNDRSSKAGLREDYEGLFRTTIMRQMVLGNVVWDVDDRQAQGSSNFEVRVRKTDEEELKLYRGSMTFHVEKADGRVRITRLFHGQWKAQN